MDSKYTMKSMSSTQSNAIVLISDNNQPNCLFDQITKNVYIGNVEAAKNKKLLSEHSIKRVVNVTDDKDNFFNDDFEYFRLSVEDRRTKFKIMREKLSEALNFIEASEKNTLIHCNAGTSRSATVLLAYVMKTQKISLKEAFEYVLSRRSKDSYTHPNVGFFQKVLLPFEKTLFGKTSMNMSDYQLMDSSGYLHLVR